VIFEYDDVNGEPLLHVAVSVNPYLLDAPNIALEKRSNPVSHAPRINYGSMALDNGHLLMSRD
jgi:hypothetical protein